MRFNAPLPVTRFSSESYAAPFPHPWSSPKPPAPHTHDHAPRSRLRSASLLRHALGRFNEGILIVSEDTTVVYHNACFAKLWGLTPKDLRSRRFPVLAQAMQRRVATEEDDDAGQRIDSFASPRAFARTLRLCDGRTLEGFVHDLRQPAGHYAVLSFRDVTAHAAAEAERMRLTSQVQRLQQNMTLGLLAGGIAHDFKNILCGIVGNAQLALMTPPTDEGLAEPLTAILKASARAEELVRRLLGTCAQGETGRRPAALGPVVLEVERLVRPSLAPSTSLSVRVDPQLPQVLADPAQVHHALVNLLSNALDAVRGRPGSVLVSLRREDLGARCPHLADPLEPGSYLLLEVCDNGPGIGPEALPRIFEACFTTKAKDSGNGLGLAIVRRIMQDHDGAVGVQSAPGHGAAFRLYFPLVEAAPEAPPTAGPCEVLVVDDEFHVLEGLCAHLRALGLRPHAVRSTDEASRALSAGAQRLQAVLCDSRLGAAGLGALCERMDALCPDAALLLLGPPCSDPACQRRAVGTVPRRLTQTSLRAALNLIHKIPNPAYFQ